ncbi:heme NO-binding protein [Rhodovulum sp. BSW8]|uniref:Heme NO-binding domain-containing protein n=3 Tax=Rhodovulum TaxID=34008 RepID=A0A4R8FQ06_9RHOB|nr:MULTISPECIES: heme NO-binding domain-containing protein [Rhodovulum]OLS44615.1 hypothetical protein BV509_09875 [Rhodovulum sulfidophilum]MBL3570807.1 heme NO-binding domain-containing protein [Rhodovulum visakhapatnamense]MBL3578598.1 heme NO-binding domain-containing protein [Rhodovulum visakhapatnamense]PTW50984.1 heme-NO-binding protein [Rhodovulum kholense]RAP42093.1 hypothetical protein BYZ73_06990 [Rhodovulum viride]
MHGLINRAIHFFLADTYGRQVWGEIVRDAGLERHAFESMLSYDDKTTDALLIAASARLCLPRAMLLEDLGTYLVSHRALEPVRRLLRFGGETFLEFLFSLEDLPDRARLAVPDLDLPELRLAEDVSDGFKLDCRGGWPEAFYILQGLLRAMADDYGALVLLDPLEERPDGGLLGVRLLDTSFSAGRSFSLKGPMA